MNVAIIDLNAGFEDARPVVRIEVHDEFPSDTADYLYREATGAVQIGSIWNGADFDPEPDVLVPSGKRVILSPRRVTDFFLPADLRKFSVLVQALQHDYADPCALGFAFSTDDAASWGHPVQVTGIVAAGQPIDVDVDFFRTAESDRTMTSSAFGQLGTVVPAGADSLRVGVIVAGEFVDQVVSGVILATGAI